MTMSIKRIVPSFILVLMVLGLDPTLPAGAAQLVTPPVPGPHGMPTQSWFKEGTSDLSKDLAEAGKDGKILAIVWEQLGCYYCKLMHEVNFQDHDIVEFVRDRFEFVQLDMRGSKVVKDLDGGTMIESKLSRKSRVTGTPTIQFMDMDGKEVFRMPGYAKPPLFLTVFKYVADEAYKSLTLREYIVTKLAEAKGKDASKQTN